MNRVEYSDIHKFITSVGLILLGVALVFPAIVLQFSNSFVQIDKEKWDNWGISESGFIFSSIVNTLIDNIWWISSIIAILGILLVGYGTYMWLRRQKILNEIQDEELKSRRIQNLSQEAKKEILESEIVLTNEIEVKAHEQRDFINEYISIENGLFNKMAKTYRANYEVIQNSQISQYTYDVILKSKRTERRGDIIIEVKYYPKLKSAEEVVADTLAFIESVKYYEISQQRRATAILLVVHDGAADAPSHASIKKVVDSTARLQGKKVRFYSTSATALVGMSAIQIIQSAV